MDWEESCVVTCTLLALKVSHLARSSLKLCEKKRRAIVFPALEIELYRADRRVFDVAFISIGCDRCGNLKAIFGCHHIVLRKEVVLDLGEDVVVASSVE